MQKIYFKLLLASILMLFTINIVSYFIGFNKKQLTNPTYFSERISAIYYLTKNILVESGIHPVQIKQEEINKYIEEACNKYKVDKKLLTLLISQENEFSMTFNGGMGLTSILPGDFSDSSYNDPYLPKENIMAAAETLNNLKTNSKTMEEVILKFVVGNNIEKAKKFAKSEFIKANNIVTIYKTFEHERKNNEVANIEDIH